MFAFLKNAYHYFLAFLGNIIYWFPSRKIFVIGITGTKGKSTTLELTNAILEAAGRKTALISSLRFKIGDKSVKNMTGMTMPGRFFLQKKLRKAVDAGCQYVLVEVTSQGVLQHRHQFINWDAALVTNVQPEHIEAHGSFAKYRESKENFFRYVAKKSRKANKFFFVNDDDPSKSYFVNAASNAGKIIYFSREKFINEEMDMGKKSIGDWLQSNFNLENAAAAAAIAESQGIAWPLIQRTLQSFKGVPGRMDYVQEKPFAVVIDYAHTPDSLEKVYQTLLTRTSNKKLICVLGAAGGGRDRWKRPVLGKVAEKYCKRIVLTDEDPFDEDPMGILDQIESGFSKHQNKNYFRILDRRAAIGKAISLAKKGDTIIITGKGTEDWIRGAKNKKMPWNERKTVEELLAKYNHRE